MIHSGSRNLGYQVAKHYNKVAITLNEKYYSTVLASHELAFLPLDTEEGMMYMKEMQYCVDFALANRKLMMERTLFAFQGRGHVEVQSLIDNNMKDIINKSHNFAAMENHYGSNVLVHRKGATRARKGEIGLIPGSQGTHSYIVVGKGDKESFESCSHGAGRAMGRKEAQRKLDFTEEAAKLDAMGVVHAIRNQKDVDEAPGAYKDIAVVMERQNDLVAIVVELTPLGVIKG